MILLLLAGLEAAAGGAGRRSGACSVGLQLLVRGGVGAACCPGYVMKVWQTTMYGQRRIVSISKPDQRRDNEGKKKRAMTKVNGE